MTTLAHDARSAPQRARAGAGISLALVSAVSFGLAGALASPLLDAGWSAGSVVLVRVWIAALVVAPFGVRAVRGRWHLVRANLPTMAVYGVTAVAGAQFCFFSAVSTMDVAPALLIEYTAPVVVVVWLWLRHAQRPGVLTVGGAALAAVGLLLVLDLFSGARVDATGALWALGAMVGLAAYFLISADDTSGVPPLALASGGLLLGGTALALLAVVGALPLHATTVDVTYADRAVAWWLPLVLLALVTAALAYVSGIAASRRLGSRLASFVALSEVVCAVFWAWGLLGQLPGSAQLVGGGLILLGVVAVRLGEPEA